MTRAVSVLLRVLGLALVLAGVMGLPLVGVDGTWTAHAEIPPGRSAVLVEPSVASVLGPGVTVRVEPRPRATADGPVELFLGRGRSDDLAAYARGPDVSRVVGVDSRRLQVSAGPGPEPALARSGLTSPGAARSGAVSSGTGTSDSATAPASDRPAPTQVDLWQQQVSGPQARELSWQPTPGARSVLIATDDGSPLPALDVDVVWTDPSWLWIPTLVLLLGLLMLAGGVVLARAVPAFVVRLVRPGTQRSTPRGGGRGGGRGGTAAEVDDAHEVHGPPAAAAGSGGRAPGAATPDEPSPARPPSTSQATRGRRRKPTAWQRLRGRARPAARTARRERVPGAWAPDRPDAEEGAS